MCGQTLVRAEIALPGGAEAVFNASGFAFYRHADWLGSARLATTYAGAVYSSEAFAPFGEPLEETGTKDRSFTGMKQDLASGAGDSNGDYDFLAREYSPTQSRWWTPDPAGLGAVNPNNPQTWDRYAYAGGTPLEATGPSGLCGVVFGGITESPATAGGKALMAYARSTGADVVFGLNGNAFGDLLSIAFGSAGADVGSAALRSAASDTDPIDIVTFSGGAQTFLNGLADAPGFSGRIGSVTYYSPGTSTADLFTASSGRSLAVFGDSAADDAATIFSQWASVSSYRTDCGHDFGCEEAANAPALVGGRCTNPQVFEPGKAPAPLSGGSGAGAGASGGSGAGSPLGFLGLGGITGNWGDVIGMVLQALMPTIPGGTVSVGQCISVGGKKICF